MLVMAMGDVVLGEFTVAANKDKKDIILQGVQEG